jgi:hypothetical protein
MVVMMVMVAAAGVAAPLLSMRVHVVVLSSMVHDASTIYRDRPKVKSGPTAPAAYG